MRSIVPSFLSFSGPFFFFFAFCRYRRRISHYQIEFSRNKFVLGSFRFPTMNKLIEYFKTHALYKTAKLTLPASDKLQEEGSEKVSIEHVYLIFWCFFSQCCEISCSFLYKELIFMWSSDTYEYSVLCLAGNYFLLKDIFLVQASDSRIQSRLTGGQWLCSQFLTNKLTIIPAFCASYLL